jgi:hypothetical protein
MENPQSLPNQEPEQAAYNAYEQAISMLPNDMAQPGMEQLQSLVSTIQNNLGIVLPDSPTEQA